ncbi:caprin-like protein [Leptotrombidium deliense]|uniref:Caprin-like protein n=1 Tax=Leptotrombidium deliense TaxID=299467 RepID=A0A443SAN0_9ACAR|nr:caprin-like protein [Leptotrombidium deliense]
MPSVFAKVEKQNSVESNDPLKQVQNLVEKKIRNLEKRKGKLEQLKEEQQSGKTLHDDQKKAVKRFDEVIEMLDFFKEFNKNVCSIFTEHSKLVKKNLKKEQLERQQQEAERLKTVLMFQDLLNAFGTDETKNDFRNGTNGAIVLSEEKLDQLDELYKLVQADRSRVEEPFDKQLESAGERWIALVEGKNREAVKGTTFKELKELLMSISVCGYFDKSSTNELNEDKVGDPTLEKTCEVSMTDFVTSNRLNGELEQESDKYNAVAGAKSAVGTMNTLLGQTGDNPGYNFLQESRIMDPAVVAIAPIPGGYGNQFTSSAMTMQTAEALATQMASIPITSASSTQKPATTYDPVNSHQPIPTQTFTNQNFAAMMGTAYIPAATLASTSMALGLPVQHIPVQSISPHHTTPSPDMIAVQDPNQQLMQQHITNYQDSSYQQNYHMEGRNDNTSQENTTCDDNSGYTQNHQQGGYRGRSRGGNRGNYRNASNINGHSRGGKPQNRGGYQGSYSNNYNSNTNGPYYGNDKRGGSNPKGMQSNRAGGRSAGGTGLNRNASGNFGNK